MSDESTNQRVTDLESTSNATIQELMQVETVLNETNGIVEAHEIDIQGKHDCFALSFAVCCTKFRQCNKWSTQDSLLG